MEYGLIGKTLKHSFSKEIHEKLFDYTYELCEIAPDDLDSFMKLKDFKAINVTIPYKEDVIPYLDDIDEGAKAIGAVNTVVNHDGKLFGYNTDFYGMRMLVEKLGITLEGKKALILGSGGTSKTAKAVAKSLGAANVLRVSRNATDELISYDEAIATHSDADIIINTTPVGMYPDIDGEIIDIDKFSKLSGVIDAIYNPLNTRLIDTAISKGIPAAGGLYMLVAQAAVAAEKFTGKEVPASKIDEVYYSILKDKQNIVLIGMPGAGKTTIGKIIAEKTDREFIDTDDEMVKAHGVITDIFANEGEKKFREYEAAIIKDVSMKNGLVIATGGGAVLNEKNIIYLRQNGIIFFIDRDIDEIVPTDDRPLALNKEAVKKRYEERLPLYTEYGIRVENKSADDTASKILKEFAL